MSEKKETNRDHLKVLADSLKKLVSDGKEKEISFDSEIISFLSNLAQKENVVFKHNEDLQGLRLIFNEETATIEKGYEGGTIGHSDGKLVYRVSRSEVNKYPWLKKMLDELSHALEIIKIMEDK